MLMNSVKWRVKDTIALLVIPLELILGTLLIKTVAGQNLITGALVPLLLKIISLLIIIFLYKELLREHWVIFKKRLWLKLLFCGVGAAAMYFVLSGTRWVIGIPQSAQVLQEVTGGLPYGVFLLASVTPLLAPVTEEIIFRHVLFYKFKDSLPLRILMFFVSAFLFGAIHINNFGGNLWLTIPYMVVALVYNVIYYFTKNIWFSITIHLIFNSIQSIIPALLIPFLIQNMG